VGRSFAYKLVQSGEIKAVRVGRCLRVRATDLEEAEILHDSPWMRHYD